MIRGPCTSANYGIEMAESCGFGSELVEQARQVLMSIDSQEQEHQTFSKFETVNHPNSALSDTQRLLGLRYAQLTLPALRKQLQLIRRRELD